MVCMCGWVGGLEGGGVEGGRGGKGDEAISAKGEEGFVLC
jgi:hypothetical protein